MRDDFSFLFNVAPVMSEPDLHALIDNFSNQYQVLGDCQHMKDVPHYPFPSNMDQRDIVDVTGMTI